MQSRKRLWILLFFVTFTLLLVNTSCGNQNSENVYLSDCGAGTFKRPSSITLTCADGGMSLRHISYSSWNSNMAQGSATFLTTCREACPHGQTEIPVTFSLSGPKKNMAGTLVFSKLKIYAGSILYNGRNSDTFNIGVE